MSDPEPGATLSGTPFGEPSGVVPAVGGGFPVEHQEVVAGGELRVPPLVRQRALAGGEGGRRWLDELPGVVARLASRWDLTVGEPHPGGTAGYVAMARTGSGLDVVVKVSMPLDDDELAAFRRSVVVHELADGRGCARLLASDGASAAMLLERLGPNLHQMGMSVPEILRAVAVTLPTFWRPYDARVDLPSGADKAVWLASSIVATWEQLDRPCGREVVDRAVRYCDERAAVFDARHAVLVHGDAHGWNTVTAGGDGFRFVDPEGVWSEPAHDLGVPMREYNQPLLDGDTARLVRERAEVLGSWCGVEPEAIWQWGFVERVSTGLLNVRDFGGDAGAAFLEVARRSE